MCIVISLLATTSGRRYEADYWITWHKTKHIGSKSGGWRLPRSTVPYVVGPQSGGLRFPRPTVPYVVGPQSGRKRVLPGLSIRPDTMGKCLLQSS